MAVQRQKYNTTGASSYYKPAFIDVVKNCNGFTVTNIGDTTAFVNDMVLFPGVPGVSLGDSRTIGGNENEIYVGNIKLSFDVIAPGVAPQIEIIQKFFID